MEVLDLLVPIALIFVFIALRILFWAINNGQYDDLDTEAHKILFDQKKSSGQASEDDSPLEDSETQGKPQ